MWPVLLAILNKEERSSGPAALKRRRQARHQCRTGRLRLFWAMLARFRRGLVLLLGAGGVGLSLSIASAPAQVKQRPGQAQAAGQFLRALLHGHYAAAYARLAPEVRQGLPLSQFAAAARPLWKSGQRHGASIELYKLGVRLGDRGGSRLFYSFSFAADSLTKSPSELLEVTFRDTATRAVLSFSLRGTPPPARERKPAPQATK